MVTVGAQSRSGRRRLTVAILVGLGLIATTVAQASPREPGALRTATAEGLPSATPGSSEAAGSVSPEPSASVLAPGHEVYGYVPYWEMDATIPEHVASLGLTTLGLFSVSQDAGGQIATNATGYSRVTGPIGRRLVGDMHRRHLRVELVFTSFDRPRNERFFGAPDQQAAAITDLVRLMRSLGTDGINVDVEGIDPRLIPAYGDFVGRLREAVLTARPTARVTVATTSGPIGAAMASVAAAAGADRIFLMGYEYYPASGIPGPQAPLVTTGDHLGASLTESLDLYRALGVPVERTLLGLPLYGVSWPVDGPENGAPATGTGATWIPSQNLGALTSPSLAPTYDPLASVEMLTVPSSGTWRTIWYDSPRSLEPKLALAEQRGLAGAGFWAIGYTRGIAAYSNLIASYRAGDVTP